MAKKLKLFVSEDEHMMAGYTIDHSDDAETNETLVTIKAPADIDDGVINETLAIVAEGCADDYETKANYWFNKANNIEEDIRYYVEKGRKIQRKIKFWKKAILASTVSTTIVGFILGVMFATAQVLTEHGPTVTLIGTLGAYAIYTFSGVLFACFFGLLGRGSAVNFVECYKEDLDSIRDTISEQQAEQANCLNKHDEYLKLARSEKIKAWQYRGLL